MVLIGQRDEGADLGMTDAEIAATIHLVGVVLEERAALTEILDQLLVGGERTGMGDRQTRAYFQDLADAVEAILTAADGVAAGRVAASPIEERA